MRFQGVPTWEAQPELAASQWSFVDILLLTLVIDLQGVPIQGSQAQLAGP